MAVALALAKGSRHRNATEHLLVDAMGARPLTNRGSNWPVRFGPASGGSRQLAMRGHDLRMGFSGTERIWDQSDFRKPPVQWQQQRARAPRQNLTLPPKSPPPLCVGGPRRGDQVPAQQCFPTSSSLRIGEACTWAAFARGWVIYLPPLMNSHSLTV
jgi:hypothetical protein